jgi:hypothetical protein
VQVALAQFLANTAPTMASGLGHNGDITIYKESVSEQVQGPGAGCAGDV